MKTGRNLQEVLVELDRQNKAKQDFISPAQGMRLREDGHTFEINHLTTNQQEVFGTTSLFHRQVASTTWRLPRRCCRCLQEMTSMR